MASSKSPRLLLLLVGVSCVSVLVLSLHLRSISTSAQQVLHHLHYGNEGGTLACTDAGTAFPACEARPKLALVHPPGLKGSAFSRGLAGHLVPFQVLPTAKEPASRYDPLTLAQGGCYPSPTQKPDNKARAGLASASHSKSWPQNWTLTWALPSANLSEGEYFKQLRGIILGKCNESTCQLKRPVGRGKFFDRIVDVTECHVVFGRELRLLDALSNRWPPPAQIPKAFCNDFTMGDLSLEVTQLYHVENAAENPLSWSREMVEEQVQEYSRGNMSFGTYGGGVVEDLLGVLRRFQDGLRGKHCAVIGSQSPWIETLLLHLAAAHVTTIEYKRIDSAHPRLSTMLPADWYSLWEQGDSRAMFDCIVTFSSLEHAGLGRYQDILNPWGDLLAMNRVRCSLREGGLVFLGLPTGLEDALVWNAHRVYGPKRWAQMLAGLEQLEVTEVSRISHAIAVARRS